MSNNSDFSAIQAQIISYLKNQSQFTSYNFSGSALSLFTEILSYNTAIAAATANLSFNEAFLDTANQRSNVVSQAKSIGYIPRSATAPTAQINILLTVSGNPEQYLLPAGTAFSTNIDTTSYTYVTTQDYVLKNVSNTFSGQINIVQGVLTSFRYVVDTSLPQQRFTIPSQDVDLDYLSVTWKNQSTDSLYTPLESANSIGFGKINSETLVYFVQEAFDGYFDVSFGDGIFGKALGNGNIVLLNYLITNEDASNGAMSFSLSSSLSNVTSISIDTVSNAVGGSQRETVDSIKFLAPLVYQAQDRAVTSSDYTALLKNNLGNINDVTCWGGELQNPPFYGKVFIAIAPVGDIQFTVSQKDNIISAFLSNYNIVGVRPTIVDPNYLFVNVDTTIRYNAKLFNANSNISLQSDITTAITNFFNTSVNKFGQNLYFTQLTTAINAVSPVIETNITNLTLQRELEIVPSVATQYLFNFNNAIAPNSVASNQIVIGSNNYFMLDLPQGTAPFTTGNIAIYSLNGDTIQYFDTNVGTVNYNTGVVNIPNLKIDNITLDPIDQLLVMSIAQGSITDAANHTVIVTDNSVYCNGREDIIVLGTITVSLVGDQS